MAHFLKTYSVLVLNSLYQSIGTTTPQKSLVGLSSSGSKVIDVVYKKDANGDLILDELDYWQPLTLEEWLEVGLRPNNIDRGIHSCRLTVRAPTVIVTSHSKMVFRRFRPTKQKLYEMQDGRCGYTNEPISFKRANIEHKIPKSHGGRDTFDNLMIVEAEINSKRGNRPLDELGLRPIFHHREPQPVPVCHIIKKLGHNDWRWFINA
jgi:5-methylcytosine-specific restriction endonuclease McrA